MCGLDLGGGISSKFGDQHGGGLGNMADSLAAPFEMGGIAMGGADWAADVGTPFSGSRPIYEQMLMLLMKDPSSIMDQPGFKFGMDQGLEGVTRKLSASGFSGSGNEMLELQRFGQGYAGDWFMKQAQLLAQLAGSGITPNVNAPNEYMKTSAGAGNDLWNMIGSAMGGMM